MNNDGLYVMPKCIAAFIMALLLIAPAARASETIKVITINAPSWVSHSSQTGMLSGAFIDVLEELTKRTDYNFEITLSPFARVGRELQMGTQDCTILAPLPSEQMQRGELILEQPLGAIGRKGITLDRYEDLYGKRISVLRGVSLRLDFSSDAALDKVFDKDYATGLRKLARDRVDVVVGAISTLQYIAKNEGIGDSLGEPLVLAKIPLLFQCSKSSQHLDAMKPINAAIRSMHSEGVIEAIKDRHGF